MASFQIINVYFICIFFFFFFLLLSGSVDSSDDLLHNAGVRELMDLLVTHTIYHTPGVKDKTYRRDITKAVFFTTQDLS